MIYLRRLRCALTDHDRETLWLQNVTICRRCGRTWQRR